MQGTTREVFIYIQRYMLMYVVAPTLKEIAEACNLARPSSVTRHLAKLETWGFIRRIPHQTRGIQLTELGRSYIPPPE